MSHHQSTIKIMLEKICDLNPFATDFSLEFEICEIVTKSKGIIVCRIVDDTGIVDACFDKFPDKLDKDKVYKMQNLKCNVVDGHLRVQMKPETKISLQPTIFQFKDKCNDVSKQVYNTGPFVQQNQSPAVAPVVQSVVQPVVQPISNVSTPSSSTNVAPSSTEKEQVLIPLSKQQHLEELKRLQKNKSHPNPKTSQQPQKDQKKETGAKNNIKDNKQKQKVEKSQTRAQKKKHNYVQKEQFIKMNSNKQENYKDNKNGKNKEEIKYREKTPEYNPKDKNIKNFDKKDPNTKNYSKTEKYQNNSQRHNNTRDEDYTKKNPNPKRDYNRPQDPSQQNHPQKNPSHPPSHPQKNPHSKNPHKNPSSQNPSSQSLKNGQNVGKGNNEQNSDKSSKVVTLASLTPLDLGPVSVRVHTWFSKENQTLYLGDSTGSVRFKSENLNLEQNSSYQLANLAVAFDGTAIFLKQTQQTQVNKLDDIVKFQKKKIGQAGSGNGIVPQVEQKSSEEKVQEKKQSEASQAPLSQKQEPNKEEPKEEEPKEEEPKKVEEAAEPVQQPHPDQEQKKENS